MTYRDSGVKFIKRGGKDGAPIFENRARKAISETLSVFLKKGKVSGVPKEFDMISDDGSIAGDAKYYTLVKGKKRPSGKISTITEYVWLLEKTNARIKFLIFGNDRRVPVMWLNDYGHLNKNVIFYFMDDFDQIELLN